MNRVIKFRIPFFNKDGSLAFFGYWGTIDHIGKPSLDHGCFTSPSSNGLTKGWHQQFTGLLDKNGKEVYEGDIIKRSTGYKFEMKLGQYILGRPTASKVYGYNWQEGDEVIGNIYETPELLSQ